MGYGVYQDHDARDWGVLRWAGYMVPAECDWPDCHEKIDRGLGYKCEEHTEFDDEVEDVMATEGCGLYFCSEHRYQEREHEEIIPKPDVLAWRRWQLYDESWGEWRDENPAEVAKIISELNNGASEDKERILLLHIRQKDGHPEVGNSIILMQEIREEIPKYEAMGWVVAETHMPVFGDPHSDVVLALAREQWEELQDDL